MKLYTGYKLLFFASRIKKSEVQNDRNFNYEVTYMNAQKEVIFLAQEDSKGEYIAWAQGYDIYTQADSWE